MGLSKRINQALHEKVENWKTERKEQKDFQNTVKAEEKVQFRKGYAEGVKKGAYQRGVAAGAGTATQSKPGVGGAIGNFGQGVTHGLKRADNIFGFSGPGGGFGLGFGEEMPKKRVPPQRVTTVSRSGVVKISEPVQPQQQPQKEWDPWAMGPPERSEHDRKKEKHFYDPF